MGSVNQRFGFDLLDTDWRGFVAVAFGPDWGGKASGPAKANKDGSNSGSGISSGGADSSSSSAGTWRGVERPPPYQKHFKQVEVKRLAALGRPVGQKGLCTTIFFCGHGNLNVPRSLLPNWVISWLVKLIGRFVYKKALELVSAFDTSEHGKRLRVSGFYAEVRKR